MSAQGVSAVIAPPEGSSSADAEAAPLATSSAPMKVVPMINVVPSNTASPPNKNTTQPKPSSSATDDVTPPENGSTTLYSKVTEGIRTAIRHSQDRYHKRSSSHPHASLKECDAIEVQYEVHVFTGDVFNASTKSGVFISLFGSEEPQFSGVIQLNDDTDVLTRVDDAASTPLRFQRGQHDTFLFKCANMGDLKKIRIGHDGIGSFAAWNLERVTIIDRHTTKSYTFPCGRWLATTRDDGQIVRDLQVDNYYDLKSSDFKRTSSEVFSLGGKDTCKDYCAKVFRNIREIYDVNHEQFIKSWVLEPSKLIAKEGAGRSGSLFLRSNDHQYMMKTIPADEVQSLLGVLRKYYDYLQSSPGTLIMKVFSLLRFELSGQRLYIMIFNNVLYGVPRELRTATYDLKGRVPKPGKALMNQGMGSEYVFKDKDLDRVFPVKGKDKVALLKQLDQDIYFFSEANLMDYSLLVGTFSVPSKSIAASYEIPKFNKMVYAKGGHEVYCIGFIDCLTRYNWKKKTAHAFKTRLWNADTLSTINATRYAERIRTYLMELFEGSDKDITVALAYARARQTHSTRLKKDTLTEQKLAYVENAVGQLTQNMTKFQRLLELLQKVEGTDCENKKESATAVLNSVESEPST
eukprot:CFRG3926T1